MKYYLELIEKYVRNHLAQMFVERSVHPHISGDVIFPSQQHLLDICYDKLTYFRLTSYYLHHRIFRFVPLQDKASLLKDSPNPLRI